MVNARYDVFTWRDEDYVKVLLKELKSENGSLEALKAPENPHQIKALRAEWGMEKKEQRLLYANADDCKKIKQEPAIMVRIVNLPEFLKYIFQLTVRSVDICLMVATITFFQRREVK